MTYLRASASCLLLLLGSFIGCHGVIVEVHDLVTMVTDERYISFTIDSYEYTPNVRFGNFNFSSPKVHTLLRAMSPAILRIGGSPADWLLFDESEWLFNQTKLQPPLIVMQKQDWDNLVTLTRSTGIDLLFDLNLQLRYGSQWYPSNAIRLMDYTRSRGWGDNVNFELGNEPDAYNKPGEVQISGEQVAQDFIQLRKVMDTYQNLNGSFLVGPDVIGATSGRGSEIVQNVAKYAAPYLDAITVHQYYFKGGGDKDWEELTNPAYFGSVIPDYVGEIQKMIRNVTTVDIPIWIGETADCWHSGSPNVTNRYVSGFLWLDKLGQAAKAGVKVVMRQTFYGHFYGLINVNTLDPNPDYWLSLLYKRLVGHRVLDYSVYDTAGKPNTVKVYAHCTEPQAGYPPGALTVYALNINHNLTDILAFLGDLATQMVDVYLMTPGAPEGPLGLLSRTIALNGEPLMMLDDTTLPPFTPVTQRADFGVKLPPLTFGFFVFPSASLSSCKS